MTDFLDCPGCPGGGCAVHDEAAAVPPSGWRLGLVFTGLFLVPVVLAIAGAVAMRDSAAGQLVGGLAGLGLGLVGAMGASRALHRTCRSETDR
ncbi:MAG: hypothetical protein JXB62_07475 [Pirellulales bacterium]|nr:hypothetical protein [Pirellulales bacterium]